MQSLSKSLLNIIIINDYGFVQGGASQVAIDSAVGLADKGHNVSFVYGVGPHDKKLNHPNIKLVDFEQFDLLGNPSRLNAAVSGVWNKSARDKFNYYMHDNVDERTLIHVHTWVKSLSVSVVNAAIKSNCPVVVTLHDYFTACPNGGFYNYQKGKACPLKPMSYACLKTNCDARSYPQKIWRSIRQGVTSSAGVPKNISDVIYVSEFSREILAPYLAESARHWHVENPIDIKEQPPATPSLSNSFSYIGRLAAEKGVLTLAEVARCHPEYAVRFVGTGELEGSLKGLLPMAEFTGWVNRDQISHYLSHSRALVFPSRWYETQGMTVAEASARGIPSIVSDACAAKEYVEHEYTGLLFKGGDEDSLNTAILRLHENPVLADQLGRNAYARFWSEPPSLARHVAQLEETYRGILGRFSRL